MKKNTFYPILLTFVVITIIFSLFIFGNLGVYSAKSETILRQGTLEKWHAEITNYISINKNIPHSLFDVCKQHIESNEPYALYLIFMNQMSDPIELTNEIREELKKTDKFLEIVEYELFISHDNWFIIEKKPGVLYKNKLMIDKFGNIYAIEVLNL